MKKVEVEWVDAHTWAGWRDGDEAKEIVPAKCTTIGYLINRKKGYLRLTSGYDECSEKYDGLHVIPTSWVTVIRELN